MGKVKQVVYVHELEELIQFAQTAAENFSNNPDYSTFTAGDVLPGCLFAVKWGLHERAVLVLKLDENFSPLVFDDIIQKKEE